MLLKQDKEILRSTIFRHLDGIATATSALALQKKGVLDYILKQEEVEVGDLCKIFNANEGYLNVALHVLTSQGWLKQMIDSDEEKMYYTTNSISQKAFSLVPLYSEAVNLLNYSVKFPTDQIGPDAFVKLQKIFKSFEKNFGLLNIEEDPLEFQVLKHLEGVIAAPLIVLLGMNGLFHKYFMEASFSPEEYHRDPESFKSILDFFTNLGWFKRNKETYQFTDTGLFYAKRASAYGVTVSYLPTFIALDDLIFGNPNILRTHDESMAEKHVNREMNVWGSGGAHSSYFKVIDSVIVELFDKPIDEQPKGILDMGCGNGALLQHMFDVIEHRTKRGKMLDEHPLLLVGADFNKAALKVTRANLIKADIWAKVVWGDIGRPDLLAADLKNDYGIALEDLLNVRTFLDHNRIWEPPTGNLIKESKSTAAFAYKGKRLKNVDVENSLLDHLNKWKPYIEKFGLLLIELHTIDPHKTAKNLGKTAVTAYDATHGYSDQYILEIDIFNKIAKLAGLHPDTSYFTTFPNSELATISINLLRGMIKT